jgi:hypothetical protein
MPTAFVLSERVPSFRFEFLSEPPATVSKAYA